MLVSSDRMPGRSWGTELFARSIKRLFLDANERPVHWLRQQIERTSVPHSALIKTRFNQRPIANIDCLIASPRRLNIDSISTIIVYMHGGGYVFGSPRAYRSIIAQLACSSNSLLIAPDYRLAPEHPLPVPQDDCLAVVEAVLKAYPERNVLLAGDSAGGALAIASALKIANDTEAKQPDALVLISPWVEPTAVGGSMKANADSDCIVAPFLAASYSALIQSQDYLNPRANFRDVDLSGLPKTLIQYGAGELLFDQIQAFTARAEQAGVDVLQQSYVGQFHDFQLLSPALGDARKAIREIASFIGELS